MDTESAPPAMVAMAPLAGGWSGQTFVSDGPEGPQVVRLYPPGSGAERGEAAPEVDAALLRLVRGLLPVPEVIEVRRPSVERDEPGLLVTALVDGERGDLLLPTLDDAGLRAAGHAIGEVAAVLGGVAMLRDGPFVDADLRIGSWGAPASLVDWVESCRDGLAHWTTSELDGLTALADEADGLLAGERRRCLVHSDLNPKNLLLDPGTLQVTAVLDWEFAHAGHPATDLGNVLRFERGPRWASYADAVVDAYLERHPGEREDVVRRARAADVLALVLLAVRRDANPVAARAHDLLLAMARAGRLHVPSNP